jgi:hypothetical protein
MRYLLELNGLAYIGRVPPVLLNLSDGSHVDSTGLIPLLRRRCPRIFAVHSLVDASVTNPSLTIEW